MCKKCVFNNDGLCENDDIMAGEECMFSCDECYGFKEGDEE